MNDLSKDLFANLIIDNDMSVVCVEHKKFIPCRKCLYDIPATIPYSSDPKDVKVVSEHHSIPKEIIEEDLKFAKQGNFKDWHR